MPNPQPVWATPLHFMCQSRLFGVRFCQHAPGHFLPFPPPLSLIEPTPFFYFGLYAGPPRASHLWRSLVPHSAFVHLSFAAPVTRLVFCPFGLAVSSRPPVSFPVCHNLFLTFVFRCQPIQSRVVFFSSIFSDTLGTTFIRSPLFRLFIVQSILPSILGPAIRFRQFNPGFNCFSSGFPSSVAPT